MAQQRKYANDNGFDNKHPLKDIMTKKPLSAKEYASIRKAKHELRRKMERARETKMHETYN